MYARSDFAGFKIWAFSSSQPASVVVFACNMEPPPRLFAPAATASLGPAAATATPEMGWDFTYKLELFVATDEYLIRAVTFEWNSEGHDVSSDMDSLPLSDTGTRRGFCISSLGRARLAIAGLLDGGQFVPVQRYYKSSNRWQMWDEHRGIVVYPAITTRVVLKLENVSFNGLTMFCRRTSSQ